VLAKESDSVVPWPLVGGRVMFGVWQCAGSASHVAQHHAAPPPLNGGAGLWWHSGGRLHASGAIASSCALIVALVVMEASSISGTLVSSSAERFLSKH
jgi:hypothetical protein